MSQYYVTSGALHWVHRQPEPQAPVWTDGTEGEWFRVFTLKSLSESVYGEVPETRRVVDGYLRRDRSRVLDDGTREFGFHGARPDGQGRAPLGERDREFRNLDLRAVQWEADEWDVTLAPSGHARVSEFHDLVAHMREIPLTDDETVVWNRERTESGEWVDAKWSPHRLAERLAKFEWNEDFWRARRVPESAWAGFVHTGRFVYLGDSVYSAVIVKWRPHGSSGWSYTVFWRESLGFESNTKGRRYRVWRYHAMKTFTSMAGPSYLDRQGALAFADRLEAKARLEAELVNDLRESMGERVERPWDRDEFSYDPAVLVSLSDGGWSDES